MVVAHPMLIPAIGVQYCRAKRPPQLLPVAYRPIAGNLAGVGCGLRNAENAAVLDDGRIQMGEDPVERLAALGRKLTHEQRIGAVHVAPHPILHEFDLVDDVAAMFVGPVGVQVPDVVAEERVVRFGLHFHHGHRGASLGPRPRAAHTPELPPPDNHHVRLHRVGHRRLVDLGRRA